MDQLIAVRRRAPREDDFISLLMAAEVEGHHLTDREIHSFTMVQFGAGFETTADAISVALHYLAEHPETFRRVAAEPEIIPAAVEEFLRFVSPIQVFGRNAAHDRELHGRHLKDGDIAALSFGSANHDPSVFPELATTLHLFAQRMPAFRVAPAGSERGVTWKTRGDPHGIAVLPVVIESAV